MTPIALHELPDISHPITLPSTHSFGVIFLGSAVSMTISEHFRRSHNDGRSCR